MNLSFYASISKDSLFCLSGKMSDKIIPKRAGSNQGREAWAKGKVFIVSITSLTLNKEPKMLARAIKVTSVTVTCMPIFDKGKNLFTITIITITIVTG